MVKICKFKEYLSNSRNISCETKEFRFDICKVPWRKFKMNSSCVDVLKILSKNSKMLF